MHRNATRDKIPVCKHPIVHQALSSRVISDEIPVLHKRDYATFLLTLSIFYTTNEEEKMDILV
jgi:hypothetical protein